MHTTHEPPAVDADSPGARAGELGAKERSDEKRRERHAHKRAAEVDHPVGHEGREAQEEVEREHVLALLGRALAHHDVGVQRGVEAIEQIVDVDHAGLGHVLELEGEQDDQRPVHSPGARDEDAALQSERVGPGQTMSDVVQELVASEKLKSLIAWRRRLRQGAKRKQQTPTELVLTFAQSNTHVRDLEAIVDLVTRRARMRTNAQERRGKLAAVFG